MNNTSRSQHSQEKTAKEKVDGQTYRLPIWNGILKHCSEIKDGIWLLLLLINWTTQEEAATGRSADRGGTGGLDGIVRGGIVVSDGITAKEIAGTTRKTILRWRERLASHEFIRQDRKNYGYVIRVLKSKKWDAAGAKGTFRIPVSTGIFDHYKKLKSSIWLFFWYIDKTTVEEDGYGHVLGGKPVLDSVPAKVLGVSNDTIAAWRENLERHGYIRARRTPYGHVISVAKSKKWVGKKPSEMSQNPVSQMSQNPVSLKNSTSEMSRSSGSDVPIPQVGCPKKQGQMSQKPGNKEDIAVDFTGTVKGQNSACQPELLLRGTASPCDPLLPEKSEMHSNRKEKESSPAPAPTRRDMLLVECDKELAKRGIGPELYSDRSVDYYRDIFVMDPWTSFERRLAALRNEARLHKFKIHPKLLKAQRETVAA